MTLIKLSDRQSLSEAYERGEYVDSVDYKIVSTTIFNAGDTEYVLSYLDEPNLYIIKKTHGDESYYIFCSTPEFFFIGDNYGGTRQEYIDNHKLFLFKEPKDPSNYKVQHLMFTDYLDGNDREGNPLTYVKIDNEIYGSVEYKSDMFTLKHFRADRETEDTELILIETYTEFTEINGLSYIQVFNGYVLNDGELEYEDE